METQVGAGTVTFDKFNELLDIVVDKIQADNEFRPDTIVALGTGGLPVAAALAKRLSIHSQDVAGIPVFRDTEGYYHPGNGLISLGSCAARQVLVVDDSSNSGRLTREAVRMVAEQGGEDAKSCVLIAREDGIQPDFVGETCAGEPPSFFWELQVKAASE